MAPEHAEFIFGTVARYAEGDASTTTIMVQSEYEPRIVSGAAVNAGIKIETVVIVMYRGVGNLGMEGHRVLDERAITECSGVLAAAMRSRQPRERQRKRHFQCSLGR